MAFIKQEPFSEEQWNQFITNFESQPNDYLHGYETTFDLSEPSVNSTTNQSLGPATSQAAIDVKTEPVDSNIDWMFASPTDQAFEIPSNEVPSSSSCSDQVTSGLNDIRTLLEENSRQIRGLHQHLAALHPFFDGMRATLKELTRSVNPQWEVKTPTTPVDMQHGKSSDCG